MCVHFQEIHSHAHGSFEGQSKILESSVIYYNSYITDRSYLEEGDKQEHLKVIVAATASC